MAELLKLAKDAEVDAIFFNEDVDPFGQAVEAGLREKSTIPIHSFQDATLHGPNEILKGDGTPYRVYTHFQSVGFRSKSADQLGDLALSRHRVIWNHSPSPPSHIGGLRRRTGNFQRVVKRQRGSE